MKPIVPPSRGDVSPLLRPRKQAGMHQVVAVDWIRFELAPWAELNVEESALDSWDDELIDQLTEKLKRKIRAHAERRNRRR